MAPQVFIPYVLAAARATQASSGIPTSFTIAQAAVESDWDGSGLSQQDFNFFGIKALGGWRGAVQTWPTREFLQGHSVTVDAPFRKYQSMEEGFEDHARFFIENERYREAMTHKDDSIAFARAVQAAGYATDPHYADAIVAVINEHQLKQFDLASA